MITGETLLTTETVMDEFQIKSKSTLNRYHKMGLRYIKGRPNRYRREEIERFFKSMER
jgi:hypothetical protein